MGVKKFYDYPDVKAAMDRGNYHYYRALLMVRSDVSVSDWGKTKIKGAGPGQWAGHGNDTGHVYRHVKGTEEAGKSTYEDEYEAVMCTRELLNGSAGQKALGDLDVMPIDDPQSNIRFKAPVVGAWYGFPSNSTTKKKIISAVCVIMKLGADTLWIHTSYPDKFQTDTI
jgi:hypothetical protein